MTTSLGARPATVAELREFNSALEKIRAASDRHPEELERRTGL